MDHLAEMGGLPMPEFFEIVEIRTKWSKRSHNPLRTDRERDALFLQFCGKRGDLAKWHVNRFVDKFPVALVIHGYDDWCQIGRIALLRAATLWDESQGWQFKTFASKAILNELSRTLASGGNIRTPAHSRSATTYRDLMDKALQVRFLKPIDRDSLQAREDEIEESDQTDQMNKVKELMTRLNPKHFEALSKRFFERMTLEEVGASMGVSKERARQQVSNALQRMRAMLRVGT